MSDIFDVVSDPTRRELMRVLAEHSHGATATAGGTSVGELVEQLGLSQPTVSKHLRVLREHDVVSVREEGQHRYYRLEPAPLEEVERWVAPFLSDAGDRDDHESAASVYAAWSGADVGATIGRSVAERTYRARNALDDMSKLVSRRLPASFRRRGRDRG